MIRPEDEFYMQKAVEEARIAKEEGEIPVGCIAVCGGRIIARAHNTREASSDPTAHAEVLAIRGAAQALGVRRLSEVALYVTLEPCAMCAGAIIASRIGRLVYGSRDPQRGCAGSLYRITEDPAMDWFCPAEGGCLQMDCDELLASFRFKSR